MPQVIRSQILKNIWSGLCCLEWCIT